MKTALHGITAVTLCLAGVALSRWDEFAGGTVYGIGVAIVLHWYLPDMTAQVCWFADHCADAWLRIRRR